MFGDVGLGQVWVCVFRIRVKGLRILGFMGWGVGIWDSGFRAFRIVVFGFRARD